MSRALHKTGVPITQVTMVAVALAAGVVYGLHVLQLPIAIGLLAACSALLGMLPVTADRARLEPHARAKRGIGRKRQLVVGAAVVLLGLGIVWTAGGVEAARPARLLRDLGWAQALLGLWHCYIYGIALVPGSRAAQSYGPGAMARWRSGDLRFGLDLASRVVVGSQKSWAALVLETAWPEPRPAIVSELLREGPGASEAELLDLLGRMIDEGGTERADVRWQLARLACEVSIEACSRPPGEADGTAASRFIVAAAAVDGDEAQMARIFSALVVPAVANPSRRSR